MWGHKELPGCERPGLLQCLAWILAALKCDHLLPVYPSFPSVGLSGVWAPGHCVKDRLDKHKIAPISLGSLLTLAWMGRLGRTGSRWWADLQGISVSPQNPAKWVGFAEPRSISQVNDRRSTWLWMGEEGGCHHRMKRHGHNSCRVWGVPCQIPQDWAPGSPCPVSMSLGEKPQSWEGAIGMPSHNRHFRKSL